MAHFLSPKVTEAAVRQIPSPKSKRRTVKTARYLPPKVSDAGARLLESTPEPAPLSKPKPEAPQASNPQPSLDPLRKAVLKAASEPQEKRQGLKERRDRQETTSLGGWMRNIFPSQRAERGGTCREQGYWEEMEATDKKEGRSRRRVTDSHHSLGGESVSSNRIVRWNTAKELPDGPSHHIKPRRRAVSINQEALSSLNYDRRRSWTPREDSEDQISITKLGGVLQNSDTKRNKTTNDSTVADTTESKIWSGSGGHSSQMHQLFKASLEGRRQRQRLKQSGDYLGVQGVNPQTGQLDIMTPTDSSATSQERQRRLISLRDMLRNNRYSYGRPAAQKEMIPTGSEEEKFLRLQKGKQVIKELSKSVKWQRRRKQWSSAQEPDLSPITQSLKSASSGSWRQSHNPIHNPSTSPREARLVEISPLKPPHPTLKIPLLDEMIAGTPRSSNTVIRTPHRRSIANTSPTAWELFENGICFNGSSASNVAAHGYVNVNQPPHQVSPVRSPLEEETMASNDWVKANNGQPFLGLQAGRQINAEDAEQSLLTLPANDIHLRQLFLVNTSAPKVEIPPPMSTNITDYPTTHTSRTTLVRVAMGEPEVQTPFEGKLLRKAVPHLTYLKRKRNEEKCQQKILHPKGKVVHTLHSNLVTNARDATQNQRVVGLMQEQPVKKRPVGPDQTPLLKEMMEKDIPMLKKRGAILNQPESGPFHKSLRQCETDHEWIDSTIQDITTKADEVRLSAFTRTITTTGCSHQTYLPSVDEATVRKPEERQRQFCRVGCNPLVKKSPKNKLENFLVDPSLSVVQSATTADKGGPATDTASTEQITCIERRPVSAQGEVMADQLYSTSLRSTSVQHQILTHNYAGDQHRAKKRKQGMTGDETDYFAERLSSPGSYPAHLDVEDDTESHSDEEHDDQESLQAKWKSFRKEWRQKQKQGSTSQVIVWYGIALLRGYWAFIWPVLDPRTLWTKHEDSVSPLMACVMIVLAAPAAILGSVVFVQLMKLVALIWVVL